MEHKYQQLLTHISPDELDDEGLLKPSRLFYLVTVYLCKALVVVAMATATLGENTAKLIANVYPSSDYFVFGSTIGVLAIFAVVIIALRGKLKAINSLAGLPKWVARLLLPLLLVADAFPFMFTLASQPLYKNGTALLLSLINLALLYFYLSSKREQVFRWQLNKGSGF